MNSEPRMSAHFKRQLADYVEYHRDPRNCALHVFGIMFLFLAAVLPLSLWPVHASGMQISIAAILVVPALVYWLLLDLRIGMGIVGAAFLLLATASLIVNYASVAAVVMITAALIVIGVGFQIVGHRVFEGRQPALVDNPSHLLIGPMFVMAKLYIALGLRNDLAAIIASNLQPAVRNTSALPDHLSKSLPHT
jgi:uncharacterized membrane protein YGL010W